MIKKKSMRCHRWGENNHLWAWIVFSPAFFTYKSINRLRRINIGSSLKNNSSGGVCCVPGCMKDASCLAHDTETILGGWDRGRLPVTQTLLLNSAYDKRGSSCMPLALSSSLASRPKQLQWHQHTTKMEERQAVWKRQRKPKEAVCCISAGVMLGLEKAASRDERM